MFALTAGLVESRFGSDWQPFRHHLIAAIAAEPDRPYWESLTAPGVVDQRVGA